MIDDEYQVNWLVDNLPAATRYYRRGDDGFTYMNGFPVGVKRQNRYYVHNHYRIGLSYHQDPGEFEGYRVVGFEVYPQSLNQAVQMNDNGNITKATCTGVEDTLPHFDIDKHQEIIYTYDVVWTESDVAWASRWDNYLKMSEG